MNSLIQNTLQYVTQLLEEKLAPEVVYHNLLHTKRVFKSTKEILEHVANYEQRFQLPTTDVLSHGCRKLVETLCKHFPTLRQKINNI